jgi:hypothetical protein
MKKKILVVVACAAFAVVVFAFGSDEAAAQCGYGGYGGYGNGYGSSVGNRSYAYPRTSLSIGIGSYNRYPSHSYYGGQRVRGHYDYHPPTAYRHRNHLHVSPGHYDYHSGAHHRRYRH